MSKHSKELHVEGDIERSEGGNLERHEGDLEKEMAGGQSKKSEYRVIVIEELGGEENEKEGSKIGVSQGKEEKDKTTSKEGSATQKKIEAKKKKEEDRAKREQAM